MDPIFWPKEGTTGFPWPQIHWKNKQERTKKQHHIIKWSF